MKICTICKTEKPFTEFHRSAGGKDGHCSWCKPCKSERKALEYAKNKDSTLKRMAEYRRLNSEKVAATKKRCYEAKKAEYATKGKAYYEANKAAILESCRLYREANQGKKKASGEAYRAANRAALNAKQSEYQKKNWERIKAYQAEYWSSRLKSDPLYALSKLVRRRICIAIAERGYSKNTRTADMLGCDYETLKRHLELKFTSGMNWGNRGQWHIDHIIPLASAKTEEELIKLCHYTNLQPLWAKENMSKGAKILPEYSARAA